MNWLSLFWLRRTLIERSARHANGYAWALSELHQNKDPESYIPIDGPPDYFDLGAKDAIRDWRTSIAADLMWSNAQAEHQDDPLEKTQELECAPFIDLEQTQELSCVR